MVKLVAEERGATPDRGRYIVLSRTFISTQRGSQHHGREFQKRKIPKARSPSEGRAIEVSIWKNEGQACSFYSVTHRRSYKQGDEWKESDSYGQDDLLTLAKLLDLAHTWILAQHQQRSQNAA